MARAVALMCSASLFCLLCGAVLPRAHAQAVSAADEQRARAAFEEGRSAFAEGHYEGALESFQQSYALSHRPVLLFNIANSLDRLRRDEEAIDAYYRYLQALPNAENRKAVLARMNVLRRSVEEKRTAAAQLEQARAAAALRPEQVARQELASPPAPYAARETQRDDQRPLVKKWWFWTSIAGVVVVGAVVGAVVASRDQEKTQGPLLGPGVRKVEL